MTAGLSHVRMEGSAHRVEALTAVNVRRALRADSVNCVSPISKPHFMASFLSQSRETHSRHFRFLSDIFQLGHGYLSSYHISVFCYLVLISHVSMCF